jgi:hypothetical protein
MQQAVIEWLVNDKLERIWKWLVPCRGTILALGGITPCILNFCFRMRWVVSVMLRPLHFRGKAPGNPLIEGWVNARINLGSRCCREHKTSCILLLMEIPMLSLPTRRHCTNWTIPYKSQQAALYNDRRPTRATTPGSKYFEVSILHRN